MKLYEQPTLKVLLLQVEDVLTNSKEFTYDYFDDSWNGGAQA